MPGEDIRYIDSLLDLAAKNNIAISADDDGTSVNIHGMKKDRAYQHIRSQLVRALKNNRSLVLWRLNNPVDPEPPEPSGHLTFGEGVKTAAESVVPSTHAGQASMAALGAANVIAPELTLPAELGIGAFSAMAGGAFDPGSSALGNAAEGALTAVVPKVLGKIPGLGNAAVQWLQRPGRQRAPEMTAALGKTMQGFLAKIAPKTAGQIATATSDFSNASGKNTIKRVLNSLAMRDEIEGSYNKMIDTTVAAAEKAAQDASDKLTAQFKAKYPNAQLSSIRYDKDARDLLKKIQMAAKFRRNIGKDVRTMFQGIKTAGRGAFSPVGELRFATSAAKAGDSREALLKKLYDLTDAVDPKGKLTQLIQTTREAYGQYHGFKDLLNVDNVMDANGRWFNPVALQRYMDGQTNKTVAILERRLKTPAFNAIKAVVRRYAPEFDAQGRPVVADQALFPKAISLGEKIPFLGAYIRKGIEAPSFLTRQIGKQPPPITPLAVPALLSKWAKPLGTAATAEAINPPGGQQ